MTRLIRRLSILSLIIFAIHIYVFRMRGLFEGISFFQKVPTFEALAFVGLFMAYMIVIWRSAHGVLKQFFFGKLSEWDFVVSNVSFSLPALFPWFCLSLFADAITLLPFSGPKQFLQSPVGELGYIFVFLVGISIFGPVLIRVLWQCRPLENGEKRAQIQEVCAMAGLKYADILTWELFGGSMITAGVMGVVGRFRYILVTPALLNSLSTQEMESVM
ncbi:MAG: M48 family metallopeptidase, partial [Desulfovibrionales bacterium]|nr:M48 family metallopeptidase [Desulfovibrionales bacterium]